MMLYKKKTKIMCNEVARRRPRRGVMIDAEQLEEVIEYKYLGRLITSGNELSKEIGDLPGLSQRDRYHCLQAS